ELNLQAKAAEQRLARPRRLAWAGNPLLAPMWMAMGAEGLGGISSASPEEIPPRPASSSSGGHRGSWRSATAYSGTDFEMSFQAPYAPENRERVQLSLQDALLDILVTGEEEGAPLTGPIADRLRGEGALRHQVLGLARRVS